MLFDLDRVRMVVLRLHNLQPVRAAIFKLSLIRVPLGVVYLAEVRFAVCILTSFDDTAAHLLGRRVSTRAHHSLRLNTLEARKSLELR